ncbi:Sugar transporter STL1 [Cyberlindnera fabianii]|uniref:Sugar transporter STL1 n=2 Tax=Cyberlindnera fabianii TaxID=36022 RepID=A0A1V2KZP3_CYBFA|nr:Sugar transporter STL1 [Cyberlindnera fabianii]
MNNEYQELQIKESFLVGKPLLYFTTCFVSTGVLLFGFEQGVMSGLLTNQHFKDYFGDPTSAAIGTMVAILEIGALISSLMAGKVSEKIGRRRSIRYGSLIFAVGGAGQAFTPNFTILTISRFISGIGVGLLTTVVPVYQSEISPSHHRGRLACVEFTGNIVGYASSVWADYFCSFFEGNIAWRLPLSIQCFIAVSLYLGSYVIVESPRWLLNHDHDAEGIVVIADLTTGGNVQDERARNEFRDIKETVVMHRLEGESSYSYMWKRYKRRVLIAMSSQAFAQLNGINVISYYAPLVFEQAGWKGRDALLMTGFNSIIYVLSTLPPWILVDKWGRRPILLSGAIVMGLALTAISYAMYLNTETTRHMVVILVVIFNAAFGYSFGPIPWLYPPEIAPLSIRSKVASLSTASNWAFNWLVGEMTPILQELITWRLYLIHSTSCFVSFFVVYLFYPETAGVSLEDMDSLFDDRSSIASFHGSTSTYRRLDTEAQSLMGDDNQHMSGAAIARQQALLQPVTSYNSPTAAAGNSNLTRQKSESSFQSHLNSFTQRNLSGQGGVDLSVEPPAFEDIVKFKNSDANSLKSSIRRSSATVGSFVGKVFKKNRQTNGDEEDQALQSDVESTTSQDA